jgi:hypothetical protein
VDFVLTSLGFVAFLVAVLVVIGHFDSGNPTELVDWHPTRSPQVEAENEIDDVEQMLAAQNELRRRLGKPERTLDEIQAEWRGS